MATGFFTDTSVCIGCKACEVACKQWNQLPADGYALSGMSYDNTVSLSATSWRHVSFIEKLDGKKKLPMANMQASPTGFSHVGEESVTTPKEAATGPLSYLNLNGEASVVMGVPDISRWLMMSNVCKHCTNPGCLEACPTGAIVHNEFGAVYVQPDICNGCGYCVPSCPFGVIALEPTDGRAFKCTMCYDRQKDGIEPACAKACPTDSILFGDLDVIKATARQRVADLHAQGETDAYLYGVDEETNVGNLHAFFLLTTEPEAYGLPQKPVLPQSRIGRSYLSGLVAAFVLGIWAVVTLRGKKLLKS